MVKNLGIDVKPPKSECQDPNCPFHGSLKVRGMKFEGTIVTDSMQRSVVVEREYLHYIPKYERYERRRGRYLAHNPDCVGAKKGDWVLVAECRSLSKQKSHVVVEVKQ